ncbi:hypothetical protein CRE_11535 [Caenorhabditis remanei]|uniref:Uncharacterized protein n=1 Tax=Caenorhabditis remanei TaxID=31234 RepID=E3NMT1_CAERE|nr:hypothetical protein CRE_11535 [Caenorhabditis remanei]
MLKPSTSTGKLLHSASMVNLTTTTTRAPSAAPLSSAPSTTTNIYAKQYIPRSGRSVSTLRHASAEPRRAGGPAPFRIEPSDQMQLVEGFPTSFSTKKVEKMENSGNTTPPPSLTSSESDSGASGAPGLIRSASGSMLLRRTAERTRRQSESPKKTTMRRSGSVGGALSGVGGACGVGGVFPKESEDVEMKETPVLKRKRTTSMTSLLQSISTNDDAPPILTPQRTRPLRGASVGGGAEGGGASSPQKSPMKKMTSSSSPMKKRGRPEEGGDI